jgi:hypothetical protein
MMLWKMIPTLDHEAKGTIVEKIAITGKNILCKALVGLPNEVKKRLELIFGEPFDIPDKCEGGLVQRCFDLVDFSLQKADAMEARGDIISRTNGNVDGKEKGNC